MGGGVVFTGQLLPLLHFPIEFDYLHVTRYDGTTRGGALQWKVLPRQPIAGRVILVLDDILDEGHTLAAIRERLLSEGAAEVYCAVFTEKQTGRPKPIRSDFVGLKVPDRYVFGFGMDAEGAWRNLPAIYALKGR
jgi:hypoxanthine phosphoribosyltransferase